jgi:hypothetical protein
LHPLGSSLDFVSDDAAILLVQSPNDHFSQQLKAKYIVDALIIPAPLAPAYGFITLASGSNAALDQLAPLLDHLAPLQNGWLHIGELGDSGFIHQLWQSLLTPQGTPPFMSWHTSPIPTGNPNHPLLLNQPELIAQLASLLAQQQLQTQTLASICRRYLAEHPARAFTAHHPQTSDFFAALNDQTLSPTRQLATLLAQY